VLGIHAGNAGRVSADRRGWTKDHGSLPARTDDIAGADPSFRELCAFARRQTADNAALAVSRALHEAFPCETNGLGFRRPSGRPVGAEIGHDQAGEARQGIILMHDFQHATAQALPSCSLNSSRAVTRLCTWWPKVPLQTLQTLAEYDELVKKENNCRP